MRFNRQEEFAVRIAECETLGQLRSVLKEITEARLEEQEFSALYAQLINRRMEILGAPQRCSRDANLEGTQPGECA